MLTLRKIPLLRVAVAFIGGMLLYLLADIRLVYSFFILVTGLLFQVAYLFLFKDNFQHRFIPGLAVNFVFVGIGALYVHLLTPDRRILAKIERHDADYYLVKVKSQPTFKRNVYQLEVQLGRPYAGQNLGALVYFNKDDSLLIHSLKINDQLYLFTRFEPIPRPGNSNQFNYKRHLFFQRIYFQSFVSAKQVLGVKSGGGTSLRQVSCQIRQWLLLKMGQADLSGNELAIAAALIIGEERDITPQLRSAYAASGAMHVLSVSGLHIGIVFLFLRFLFKPLLARADMAKLIIPLLIILLWGYSFITGLSPSVQRAAMMFSFIAIGNVTNKKANVFNMLAASALVLLLIEPNLLMNVGFQLSYLALLGILLIHPILFRQFFVSRHWLRRVWEITSVSIAAQSTTALLSIYYFHQFPNLFMVSNLIVIPLSFIILLLGFVFVLFCWQPGLSYLIGFGLKWGVFSLNEVLFYLEQVPGAVSNHLFLSTADTWWFYIICLMLFGAFILRNKELLLLSFCGVLVQILAGIYLGFQRKEPVVNIYSIPKASVFMVRGKNETKLFSTSVESTRLNFFIGNEMDRLGIRSVSPEHTSLLLFPVVISPDSNRILLTEKGNVLVLSRPPDINLYRNISFTYLLIENSLFDWRQILNIRSQKVVIGNTIPKKLKKKIQLFLRKQGRRTYHLDHQISI